MLKLEQALLVEGKYDAARLSNIVDGTILTTDASGCSRTARCKGCSSALLQRRGLSFDRLRRRRVQDSPLCHGSVGAEHVLQAYVPAIAGKESRKAEPGKEGLLGVEGVSDDLIVQGLETALASKTACQQKTTQSRSITYTDLYDWGISGTANSAENRRVFLRRLGLPPRLSKKELLQVLNTLYTYDALNAEIKKAIKNARNRASGSGHFLYASNAIRLPVFLILPSTAYCRRRWACASRRGGTA